MGRFRAVISRTDRWLEAVAGLALVLMMLLTVTDVGLRAIFNSPILGTYELVSFLSAIVIGLALPMTTLLRGHVWVDMLFSVLKPGARTALKIATRMVSGLLFLAIAWNLLKLGMAMREAGEVSPTLQLPFYPIAWGLGVSCFIVFLTLLTDIGRLIRGTDDE